MDGAGQVRDLLAMSREFDAGISESEWAALELVLDHVEGTPPDDRLRIPEDDAERQRLAQAFFGIGWGAKAPRHEEGT
jgi:hypothetical protein